MTASDHAVERRLDVMGSRRCESRSASACFRASKTTHRLQLNSPRSKSNCTRWQPSAITPSTPSMSAGIRPAVDPGPSRQLVPTSTRDRPGAARAAATVRPGRILDDLVASPGRRQKSGGHSRLNSTRSLLPVSTNSRSCSPAMVILTVTNGHTMSSRATASSRPPGAKFSMRVR